MSEDTKTPAEKELEATIAKNKDKADKLAAQRLEANKNVLRAYRIKH